MAAAAADDDAAVRRYDHNQFVNRFLSGLTNALRMHAGPRARGVTRNISNVSKSDISTSQKVVDARMALGADDALYLQSGLGLLWAGDDNLDNDHLLFPSSMGDAGLATSTREALKAGMAQHLDGQITQVMDTLVARLPALIYVLSLPEVGRFVRDDLLAAKLLTNANVSLSRLVERLVRLPPETRHQATLDGVINEWMALLADPTRGPPLVEELITFCASLKGLYARTSAQRLSPMALADLYTSAAVDVALARDWSTMEGVMRALRARKATERNTTRDNPPEDKNESPPADEDATYVGMPRPTIPLLSAYEVEPGLGPRLPTRVAASTGVGVAFTADGAEDEAELALAAPPKKAREGAGWMDGLLGEAATVGAHLTGTGLQHAARNSAPLEHRPERNREQSSGRAPADPNNPNNIDWASDLNRLSALVLDPVGSQAALSMSMAASPLWNAEMLAKLETGSLLASRTWNEELPSEDRLWAATNNRLEPSNAEVMGRWSYGPPEVVEQRRATMHTVVHALYDDDLGPYRRLPSEMSPVHGWLGLGLPATATQPLPTLSETNRQILNTSPRDATKRGVAATDVMRTTRTKGAQAGYSDSDNRFVSYALLRGLTAEYGPNEVGREDSIAPYWRGSGVQLDSTASQTPPAALQGTGGVDPPPARVPSTLLETWKDRDGSDEVVAFGPELVRLVRLEGPSEADHHPQSQAEGTALWRETEVRLRGNVSGPIVDEDQCMENTMREVRWAPIECNEGRQDLVSYSAGAVAASAAATYEHLIATLDNYYQNSGRGRRTFVPQQLRSAMRAALKLRQLPHMIAFDEKLADEGGQMEYAMRDGRSPVTLNGEYRTLLPTVRKVGDHVYETMPSAFGGVWNRRPRAGKTVLGLGASTMEIVAKNAPSRDMLKMWATYSEPEANSARIRAPDWGLSVPHIPVGVSHQRDPSQSSMFDEHTRLVSRIPVDVDHTNRPAWLNTHRRVDRLIEDCYRLAVRVREMRLQRAAFTSPAAEPEPVPTVASLVERERRGAIWEDALREMSISQDRLYNFLRTMSGTLHEDIQAVVEVEASLALKPYTLTPDRRPCSPCAQDHGMEAANRAIRERRQEILKQSSLFQGRLIERVMGGVLRDSKLQFDLASDPNAQGARAATELVVVNKETIDRVKELAQGTSGIPFFAENVQLEQTLGTNSQPMAVADLVQRLQAIASSVREGMLNALNQSSVDGARSSLEYLSRPRNSYLVRLKPEGFAAIKAAYSVFCTEWRGKFAMGLRRPSAWELIEGTDMHLTNAFAELCAHKMAHSRMFGSSHAGYIGATPARANAIQLRMALQKVTARAVEYVQLVGPPNYRMGARSYRAEKPQDFLVGSWGF